MPDTVTASDRSPSLFSRRNLLLLLAGGVTIAAGYGLLVSGSASLGAVFLVLGYVVIFPLALLS